MKPTFTLHSTETGTDYLIAVESPAKLSAGSRAPAVLFMDGDDQFTFAVDAYRELQSRSAMPPLYLIGVGYGASYSKPANRRGRDYTPVAHSDEPSSGGADAFLRFLTNTLWSELEQRYAIDVKNRGIAGHSLGSLLVLHALFQPRPFFTHHLASAPSIWWSDRAILAQVRALREKQSSLRGKLVLSVGEKDTASMTGDLTLLETALAETPFENLDVISERFTDRDHYNVMPEAFRRGLETLFGQSRGCGAD
jgi:predicted alpha/beta superfamily hydrolase